MTLTARAAGRYDDSLAWPLSETWGVCLVDKLLVAEIGVEGGGLSIYGREDEGSWSFWSEGSSMDLDENDDEVWRSWSTDPVADLALVVPREWPLFYPMTIRPDFTGWFRDHYEEARSLLPPELKEIASGVSASPMGRGSRAMTWEVLSSNRRFVGHMGRVPALAR